MSDDIAARLIQQVLFSTQDSQGRPVVTDHSRVEQIVRTLREHNIITTSDATVRHLHDLVVELEEYLPAATKNQALSANPPRGKGTLSGFRAKVSEVFGLGRSVGYEEGRE
jgi:hypothetical protein